MLKENNKWISYPENDYLSYFSPNDFKFLIQEFLKRDEENYFLDFKNEGIKSKHLAEHLCGMANTESGIIILGIDQKNPDPWQGVKDVDTWKNQVSHIQNSILKPSFNDLKSFTVEFDDKNYLIIVVPKVKDQGLMVNNNYFYREGSTTRKADNLSVISLRENKRKNSDKFGFLCFDLLQNCLERFKSEKGLLITDRDFVSAFSEIWNYDSRNYPIVPQETVQKYLNNSNELQKLLKTNLNSIAKTILIYNDRLDFNRIDHVSFLSIFKEICYICKVDIYGNFSKFNSFLNSLNYEPKFYNELFEISIFLDVKWVQKITENFLEFSPDSIYQFIINLGKTNYLKEKFVPQFIIPLKLDVNCLLKFLDLLEMLDINTAHIIINNQDWTSLQYQKESFINLLDWFTKTKEMNNFSEDNDERKDNIQLLISKTQFLCEIIPWEMIIPVPLNFSKLENLFTAIDYLEPNFKILRNLKWNTIDWDINELISLLNQLNCNIQTIRDNYRKNQMPQNINFDKEREYINRNISKYFFSQIIKNIEWKHIKWSRLCMKSLLELIRVISENEKLPESMIDYDWNCYFRKIWKKNPEQVLLFFRNGKAFTQKYFIEWSLENKFPLLGDFLSTKKLGFLTIFLDTIIYSWGYNRSVTYFLDSLDRNNKVLLDIIKKSSYMVLLDFENLLNKSNKAKEEEFREIIRIAKVNTFLNKYHKSLYRLFKKSSLITCFRSKNYIESIKASKNRDLSIYWPLLYLPCFMNIVTLILNNKDQEIILLQNLEHSVDLYANEWNNLLDEDFYIDSLEESYSATKSYIFLKNEFSQVKESIYSLDDIKNFHILSLLKFVEIITKNRDYHGLWKKLIEKTKILEFLPKKITNFLSTSFFIQFIDRTFFFYRNILSVENNIEKNEFMQLNRNYISIYLCNSLIILLKQKNLSVFEFWKRIDLSEIDNQSSIFLNISNPNFKNESTNVLQKIFLNEPLNEFEKIWAELFQVKNQKDVIEGIDISRNILQRLLNHHNRYDILQTIQWKYLLSDMTDKGLKELFEIKKSQYHDNNIFIDKEKRYYNSFVEGLLLIFPKWIRINEENSIYFSSLDKWAELLYFSKKIKSTKLEDEWIQKINILFCNENPNILLRQNLNKVNQDTFAFPIKSLTECLEQSLSQPRAKVIADKLLTALSNDKNLAQQYFATFWDIKEFSKMIERVEEESGICFEDLYLLFLEIINGITIDLQGDYEKFNAYTIVDILHGEFHTRNEIVALFIKNNFEKQVENYFLGIQQKPNRFLDEINIVVNQIVKMDFKSPINLPNLLNTVLFKFSLPNQDDNFEPVYKSFWHNIFLDYRSDRYNPLLFTYLRNHFSKVNWKEFLETGEYTAEKLIRFNYLLNIPSEVVEVMLETETFWEVDWIKIIKIELIQLSKGVYTFFEILKPKMDIYLVKSFLRKEEFRRLPWNKCKNLLNSERYDKNKFMTISEIEEIIEFIK